MEVPLVSKDANDSFQNARLVAAIRYDEGQTIVYLDVQVLNVTARGYDEMVMIHATRANQNTNPVLRVRSQSQQGTGLLGNCGNVPFCFLWCPGTEVTFWTSTSYTQSTSLQLASALPPPPSPKSTDLAHSRKGPLTRLNPTLVLDAIRTRSRFHVPTYPPIFPCPPSHAADHGIRFRRNRHRIAPPSQANNRSS
ncbi:hypothetical protein ACRALDRAFT_209861 [Sodiomyces alcalophilus JCM 7366]|uniref:uncharacterized protein n=1 Tax=Sodiomyces alcalophilus JCM 7366 TaxID=591952 RepID=UPI0039B630A9